MTKLMGHVDRADPFLLAGWALADDKPAHYPEVRVVQQGKTVITLRPSVSGPHLRKALDLPQSTAPDTYIWRLWMPLSNGIKPDIPFSVHFVEDGAPLRKGEGRVIALSNGMDPEAAGDLRDETLFFPVFDIHSGRARISFRAAGPVDAAAPEMTLRVNGSKEIPLKRTAEPFFLNKPVYSGFLDCALDTLFENGISHARIGLAPDANSSSRTQFHNAIRTLFIPRSMLDAGLLIAPIPATANIGRVSGPASGRDQYLAGGLTTFLQLNAITNGYFDRSIFDFPSVVDWGVGCARVMRHFFEAPDVGRNPAQSVLGLDIDNENLVWCRDNMKGQGRYELLGLDGFPIESQSVDLLYGISVLTHLTEFHQHLWLSEIARVMKPGGCVILTIHGEATTYGSYALGGVTGFMVPFVDKFGFFDGIPDGAIGSDRDTYYRSTYHSRGYIRANWSRYLEVLDIIPAANAFRQDFVVLKAPAR